MTTSMSIAISTPTSSLLHSSSSSSGGKISSFSNSAISVPKNAIFQRIKCVPQLGLTPFSQWNGLKNFGVSVSQYSVKIERKGKCKGKGVYASLFGVGAPEVLVIGVVALLVFGPKGLAEVARNLGKTLRAFQPTIRELQEVSREFKSTLEREIGLDDIDNPVAKSSSSNTTEPKPGTNIEPNGSSLETGEDSVDSSLNLRADRFRGALAALQKEQEEERQQKEEQLQAQVEPQTTSEDTSEAPDTPEEASSVTPPPENPQSNSLQEAAAVAPTGSAASTESQS